MCSTRRILIRNEALFLPVLLLIAAVPVVSLTGPSTGQATGQLPGQSSGQSPIHPGKTPIARRRQRIISYQRLLPPRSPGHHRLCQTATSTIYSDDGDGADEDVPQLKRRLSREFLRIGIPALIQLAAEPLAALVDTAYLGRLGPEILGGAGVAVSAQYAVSKLYNDPLLRTSISLVATQDGKTASAGGGERDRRKELSVAVSSALVLAAVVGLVQLVVYTIFCRSITMAMGLTPQSPM